LDLHSSTRTEGGLFLSLKNLTKQSVYESAVDDERKSLSNMTAAAAVAATVETADVEVQKEQEQVRQILKMKMRKKISLMNRKTKEKRMDAKDHYLERKKRTDLRSSNRNPSLGRNRFWRYKYTFASGVESTYYKVGDGGLEKISVFNDLGLTDAEGTLAV
jgi:hypothetical protein